MKMYERNPEQSKTAVLIHPMLSSAEGIELCVTNFWGGAVHCFLPELKIWPGYAHCGRMTAESEHYAAMLGQYLGVHG